MVGGKASGLYASLPLPEIIGPQWRAELMTPTCSNTVVLDGLLLPTSLKSVGLSRKTSKPIGGNEAIQVSALLSLAGISRAKGLMNSKLTHLWQGSVNQQSPFAEIVSVEPRREFTIHFHTKLCITQQEK